MSAPARGPLAALAALLAAAAAAAGSPGAAVAAPAPFMHTCVPSAGVRLCATTGDDQRVASFDGTPLDVDVFLPAAGDGPFPAIAMLHGFAGSKADYGTGAPPDAGYSAAAFARRGYAVLVPTARGFGRSCGVPASRTPACARGYVHLADQRYEVRDVQHLLGLLVDEGVASPGALGATGISYGGGTSLMLATLRDRVRLPDGSLAPWRSPAGRPLALTAAWPRWPWSDLADALVPNGRLLEPGAGAEGYRSPVGVALESYIGALYGVAATAGYLAPAGSDPGADLTGWKSLTDAGEPYGARVTAVLQELHRFHGAMGVPFPAVASPLLLQAGWTDDLFPVGQALRAYERQRRAAPRTPLALQVGDLGHARAANHPRDEASFERDGAAFFARYLRGDRRAQVPRVKVFTQRCPRSAPSGGGPYRARAWQDLARGSLTLTARRPQRVTAGGGDASLSQRLAPLAL
ncbi:MAG TPA: CocE/NonD family hydrolase, partial [Solirubrobacteraceae bacterium]|nr:CocE/NonD family hydrolase [Solirubrobacteraceae bacterium]